MGSGKDKNNLPNNLKLRYGISAAIFLMPVLRLAGYILLCATKQPYGNIRRNTFLEPLLICLLPESLTGYKTCPHNVSTTIFRAMSVLLVTTQYSTLQNDRNDAFMKPLWIETTKPHITGL